MSDLDRRAESNVNIQPNVMLAQRRRQDEIKYLPGDFAWQVYRGRIWTDPQAMTSRQREEYLQMLLDYFCGRPCGGTCESSRRAPQQR